MAEAGAGAEAGSQRAGMKLPVRVVVVVVVVVVAAVAKKKRSAALDETLVFVYVLQPHEVQDSTIAMSAFFVFVAFVALDIVVAFAGHKAATRVRRGSGGARFSDKPPRD